MDQLEKEFEEFLKEKRRKEKEKQELQSKRGVDLYLNGELSKSDWNLPGSAVHLFTVQVFYLDAGYADDSFYFIEADDFMEICEDSGKRKGVLARFDKPEGNIKEYIIAFLISVFTGRELISEPCELLKEGYLKESDYNLIVDRFEEGTTVGNIEDIEDPHGILKTAVDLGLHPIPEGGKSKNCIAPCPGTNHFIMIVPSTGEWGCGWCKRKGKSKELRQLCNEVKSIMGDIPPT
ncbi:MAG: hypothetical protein AB2L11_03480 [Syntrophobacteraceae bacterium]